MKKKYYVVWQGRAPGIYDIWKLAEAQVVGFKRPHYRGFATLEEAQYAYAHEAEFRRVVEREGEAAERAEGGLKPERWHMPEAEGEAPLTRAVAVDAACSGNPGAMEYRGVQLWDNQVCFHHKYAVGTNNVGEFLAVVEALARLRQTGATDVTIYTDSQIALLWVHKGKCATKLLLTPRTAELLDVVARAERWLADNGVLNPLVKWPTQRWGEIPADFGRKK